MTDRDALIEAVTREVIATLGSLTVYDAFAPAPVTPDVGALYFTIRNAGTAPDRLLGVSVDVADSATLHTQRVEQGGMRMTPLEDLAVPVHGAARLVPGGHHVMLSAMHRRYDVGDSIRVSAVLEHAGVLSFTVPVVSYADLIGRFDTGSHDGESHRE